MNNKKLISFEEFSKQFDNIIKNNEALYKEKESYYKDVDLNIFGKQLSAIRIAEILNELKDNKYRKKVIKYVTFSNKCYNELERVKDTKTRVHIANILHNERRATLSNVDIPDILKSHIFTYIISKYRNIIKNKVESNELLNES